MAEPSRTNTRICRSAATARSIYLLPETKFFTNKGVEPFTGPKRGQRRFLLWRPTPRRIIWSCLLGGGRSKVIKSTALTVCTIQVVTVVTQESDHFFSLLPLICSLVQPSATPGWQS